MELSYGRYLESGFNFAEFLGYEYQFGIFLNCKTGEVINPYETKEVYEYLSSLNNLRKMGYLDGNLSIKNNLSSENTYNNILNENFVAVINCGHNIIEKIYDKGHIYYLPFYIFSRPASSTGVVKNSNN